MWILQFVYLSSRKLTSWFSDCVLPKKRRSGIPLHILTGYARFLMKQKQHKKAIDLYTSSLDVAKEIYGADHPQVGALIWCLSLVNDVSLTITKFPIYSCCLTYLELSYICLVHIAF